MEITKMIIFDTNFLIDLVRFKVDLEEVEGLVARPYQLATLDAVVSELKKIGNKNARAALKIIEGRGFKILKAAKRNVDDAIIDAVEKAVKENNAEQAARTVVATNDAELRKRIKALGAKVIYLRAKKHLEIIN